MKPDAGVSDPDEAARAQAATKALRGMVWIPEGTFLMGTDDVSRQWRLLLDIPNDDPSWSGGGERCRH